MPPYISGCASKRDVMGLEERGGDKGLKDLSVELPVASRVICYIFRDGWTDGWTDRQMDRLSYRSSPLFM